MSRFWGGDGSSSSESESDAEDGEQEVKTVV
jgi:hypothetical protein